MCQLNVDSYFRKVKDSNKSTDEKKDASDNQWTQKTYLIQKDLLKTLDQQWTEYVQATNYNRKMEEQRLSQYGQERASVMNDDQLKNQLAVDQAYLEKSTLSNKLASSYQAAASAQDSQINPNNSINEKMNTLTLQNLNSSKNQLFNSPSTVINSKKLSNYPTMWNNKPLTKADELMSIKLYNEIVMHNLNRNKSLCSSASSTSSCSSASSYAKTVNSLTSNYLSNNHLTNHQLNNHSANHSTNVNNNHLMPTMPIDLDQTTNANYISSSASSCSVNSLSSIQSSSNKSKEQDRSSSSILNPKYLHLNHPFKKRKKIYQLAFNASSDRDSDSLWRPW